MQLLTQEQGSKLKAGERVRVAWFTPRKPKAEVEPFSREFGGRQEWLEEVWKDEAVDSEPRESTSDGLVVRLAARFGLYRVDRLEKLVL